MNFTHMFAHQVADLARAVQNTRNTSNAMVRAGDEIRGRIAEVLRTQGPMTVANIAKVIGRTRSGTNGHLVRMAAENVPRVRRQSEAYNAKWEAT